MKKKLYRGMGADKSKFDLRTFAYVPDKAAMTGGVRYTAKDIEDQSSVGICTAISMTQNAKKALGTKFSADFQYLMQKKFIDKNWTEGSSALSALKVAYNYGFLKDKDWTFTTQSDRDKGYSSYIKKLQKVSSKDIAALILKAKENKITGYASVPVDRDMMANAISESKSGIIVRYLIGKEWWTAPVEPLRPPVKPLSGHLVTNCNYAGNSVRTANTWGASWADKGTAYSLLDQYKPTEAWIPYYAKAPKNIEKKQEELTMTKGQIMEAMQKLLEMLKLV
jgi:hypothetical protein